MDVSVIGKQVDIGDALRTHVQENLTASVIKYFENALDASVTLSREAHDFRADIMVHAAGGVMAHVHSTAADPYVACDGAIVKAAKQLRRQKRKLRDHQNASRRSDMELPAEKLSGEDAED